MMRGFYVVDGATRAPMRRVTPGHAKHFYFHAAACQRNIFTTPIHKRDSERCHDEKGDSHYYHGLLPSHASYAAYVCLRCYAAYLINSQQHAIVSTYEPARHYARYAIYALRHDNMSV